MAKTIAHLVNKKDGQNVNYIVIDEKDTLGHQKLDDKNESRNPVEARLN